MLAEEKTRITATHTMQGRHNSQGRTAHFTAKISKVTAGTLLVFPQWPKSLVKRLFSKVIFRKYQIHIQDVTLKIKTAPYFRYF